MSKPCLEGAGLAEQAWAPILVGLDGPRARQKLAKMGDGSEAFCRKKGLLFE